MDVKSIKRIIMYYGSEVASGGDIQSLKFLGLEFHHVISACHHMMLSLCASVSSHDISLPIYLLSLLIRTVIFG